MNTGTLRTWHDDKGFGFIAPSHGGREVFVHISAFARDGSRPTIGERLVYELGQDRDGRPRAMKVVREALASSVRAAPRLARAPAQRQRGLRLLPLLLLVALVIGGGLLYRSKFSRPPPETVMSEPREPSPVRPPPAMQVHAPQAASSAPIFGCDGRKYCSQMTSCAEATYFLKNCPGTQMDGDRDGVPCERQWCTGPLSK